MTGSRAHLWLLAAALSVVAPEAACAQGAPDTPDAPTAVAEPVKRLRLMYLDLADLRVPEEQPSFDTPTGSFRHTFGSQRRTSEETEPIVVYPEQYEADIVVLAGVGNVRAARRLFPARDWRLLQARTSPADKVGAPMPGSVSQKKPAPGVAMWLQPGVRFSGADPGLPPGFGAALRMHSGLGVLWALSPSMPCPTSAARDVASGGLCPAIEGWLGARTATGDLALVGGAMPVPQAAVQPGTARAQAAARAGPAGALPLAPRRHEGRLVLTGADAKGACGEGRETQPALVLAASSARLDQLQAAGYVLPIKRPAPPPGPASRSAPPPPPPACALLLDIGLP